MSGHQGPWTDPWQEFCTPHMIRKQQWVCGPQWAMGMNKTEASSRPCRQTAKPYVSNHHSSAKLKLCLPGLCSPTQMPSSGLKHLSHSSWECWQQSPCNNAHSWIKSSHSSQLITPSHGQPRPKDWSMWARKGLAPLPQFRTVLDASESGYKSREN